MQHGAEFNLCNEPPSSGPGVMCHVLIMLVMLVAWHILGGCRHPCEATLHQAICSISSAQGEVRSLWPQVGDNHVSADHYCHFIIKPGDSTQAPLAGGSTGQLQAKFRSSTGRLGFLPSFNICTALINKMSLNLNWLVYQSKKFCHCSFGNLNLNLTNYTCISGFVWVFF